MGGWRKPDVYSLSLLFEKIGFVLNIAYFDKKVKGGLTESAIFGIV
jgi:hypothetical protein